MKGRLLLITFVPDERDNHGVEVKEEHEQVEAQLDEGLLLVHVKLAEDLCRVEQVLVFEDSAKKRTLDHVPLYSHVWYCAYFFPFQATSGKFNSNGSQ